MAVYWAHHWDFDAAATMADHSVADAASEWSQFQQQRYICSKSEGRWTLDATTSWQMVAQCDHPPAAPPLHFTVTDRRHFVVVSQSCRRCHRNLE